MAQELCAICGLRSANVTVTVLRNGDREQLHICSYDYQKLVDQQQFKARMDRVLGQEQEDFFTHARIDARRFENLTE